MTHYNNRNTWFMHVQSSQIEQDVSTAIEFHFYSTVRSSHSKQVALTWGHFVSAIKLNQINKGDHKMATGGRCDTTCKQKDRNLLQRCGLTTRDHHTKSHHLHFQKVESPKCLSTYKHPSCHGDTLSTFHLFSVLQQAVWQ